jgi:hypothetical protein
MVFFHAPLPRLLSGTAQPPARSPILIVSLSSHVPRRYPVPLVGLFSGATSAVTAMVRVLPIARRRCESGWFSEEPYDKENHGRKAAMERLRFHWNASWRLRTALLSTSFYVAHPMVCNDHPNPSPPTAVFFTPLVSHVCLVNFECISL